MILFIYLFPFINLASHTVYYQELLFFQFSMFRPPVPPSISLSLSLEVRSPLDTLIPCLTKELWILHTSLRGWFQHQA